MAKKHHYYSNTSAYEESIRTLRTNIQFSDIDHKLKKLVITSSVPDEGKTTVAINLARSFAQNNKKVLLMDCDLRNPSVGKELNIENTLGLTNLMIGNKDISSVIIKDTEAQNLDILFSGPIPPNPSEILSSEFMKNLLHSLEDKYDYIIIDSPPAGIITDAAILSTITDAIILVAKANSTKKDEIRGTIDKINAVNGKILGVVMTFVQKANTKYGSYYS